MGEQMDPNLYRTLGELVAEVRELRRSIETNAAQVDRRLSEVEADLSELKTWRDQVTGAVGTAKWLWAAAGTGLGGLIASALSQL
jgi:hypothetical protein